MAQAKLVCFRGTGIPEHENKQAHTIGMSAVLILVFLKITSFLKRAA